MSPSRPFRKPNDYGRRPGHVPPGRVELRPLAAGITVDVRLLGQSGIGRYLSGLLPRVIERSARDFTLLGRREAMSAAGLEEGAGVEQREVLAPIYTATEQWRLWRSIPRGTELYWAPHYNFPLAYRGRLVVTLHDVLHIARPEFVRGSHRRLYARAMFAALRRSADHLICDSHFTADEVMRLLDVDASRISVVHLGVDREYFREPELNPPAERPFLLYVGNVKPHKNLGRLLEAFAELRDEIPHDLVIVGRREGLITGDQEAYRHAAALGSRVRFTGEVGEEALRVYLVRAEALVLPSLYEGFGLPALEAMASGCPVLVSRAASLPEVCGDAALYFDPGSTADLVHAIRRLLNEPGLREELRGLGAEQARRYTWDRCAEETTAVLERVLEG